ncbi:MAG: hypothetical protein ACLU5C_10915 [Acutalibacter sp.]
MEYGITAAATLASALLGVAFSLGAVRREQGPARSSALYMLARSLGLTALAAIPVWCHSVGFWQLPQESCCWCRRWTAWWESI